ncbi:MAG: hypothetical protein IJ161_00455 [Bacteroidales bacterium]|nr:hypothetical protein [Bacteroidales bacterium]
MKKIFKLFLLLSVASFAFLSCTEDDGIDNKNYGPIKVTKVYRHSASLIKELDPTVGARLGTMLRLEGENFQGIKKITCNGSPAYLNPNLITENSIIFRIPSTDSDNTDTPTGDDCDEEFRDKIIITSNGNSDYVYPFHIMGSAPTISSISHTLPSVGSWVTVAGGNLRGVSEVQFCDDLGNVVASTTGIRNEDPKGKSFQFQTPSFPADYEGGYIVAVTDNGEAASPNYFWRVKNIFLSKFYSEEADGYWSYNPNSTHDSYYAWGSGTTGNLPDMETYPDIFPNNDDPFPLEGDGPKNPEIFRAMPVPGTKIPVIPLSDGEHSADGGACIARACFNSDACSGRALGMAQNLSSGVELFNTSTPNESLALQFDYFIPMTWDSGRIAVTFVDAGIKWMANYHPWTTDPDSYKNGMKEWKTATIPLSDFPNFAEQSYGYILKNTIAGVNGEYACQGMIAFYNDECDGKPAREMTDFVLYWNNLRIVPMTTPDISEEEE